MKYIKTKIVGITLAVTMLFGGTSVLAVSPNENDFAQINNATHISYGQTLHVQFTAEERGKWYSFTPPATGTYCIYSSRQQGDPYVYIYREGNLENYLYSNDDGGSGSNFMLNCSFDAGVTYYIYCTNYGSPDPDSYDLALAWSGYIGQYILIDGNVSNYTWLYERATAEQDIVLRVRPPEYDGTYTYKWYRYNYISNTFEEIPGETSDSLTVGTYGDRFSCGITRDGVVRYVDFKLRYTDRELPALVGISQSLGNSGQATTAMVPPVDGYTVHYCACSGYYSWAAYMNNEDPLNVINAIPFSETNTVQVPGFNVTTFDTSSACEDYYTNELDSYYWYYMNYVPRFFPYVELSFCFCKIRR